MATAKKLLRRGVFMSTRYPYRRRHRPAGRLVVVTGQAQKRGGREAPVSSYESPVRLAETVTERDHIRGALEAPVVLVEYDDYECPHGSRRRRQDDAV
jgi:protein-disulfide isomerase